MAMEEVKVKISKKDGKVIVDCNGFVGEACSSIEEIENMVGTTIKHSDKDERYQYELNIPITQGLVT